MYGRIQQPSRKLTESSNQSSEDESTCKQDLKTSASSFSPAIGSQAKTSANQPAPCGPEVVLASWKDRKRQWATLESQRSRVSDFGRLRFNQSTTAYKRRNLHTESH